MIDTLQHWKNSGRFLDWQGQQLFIVDSADHDQTASEKPVLLLVHGYPTSTWDFSHLWPQLSARFRVIGADLLGLGFSSKPRPHHYCMAEQADLMEFVLQQAGVQQCHVLAHDYGDTVTQELLARDLERAQSRYQSVILLNGGLFPETHHARTMQKLMASPLGPLLAYLTSRRKLLGTFSSVFGRATQPDAATLEAVWQLVNTNHGLHALPPLLGYMAERRQHRERWVNALRQARMPLALVNGSADPVSGAHMVARFREVVGTQHFIRELPGIGHYPQLEAPQAVLEACVEFWRGIGLAA
ncbi:alpha/beta fold hydrolase [Pseudomonas sp. N040]|uniref:alpha/beta fold hydrolase n=1 Tax=Pseudomonas sp. N040 TaxID=2785325 RepID=UPI0018A2574C|nr:alpha/beta hydrolase [Pseudomonas sp. N040]MBF7728934.1 alpha/beta hydrolase [Pseudomonas sp. N040]MBW7012574.1 alpha/beta hydrolase [Pseudomonas sp. N040]